MFRKNVPLLAATFLSISLVTQAAAATTDGDAVALSGTAVVAANAAQKKPNSSQCKKDSGLYDRLGGIFGIAKVVDLFSDAIIVNPALNQNPALIAWNTNEKESRLPGLKVMRTIWIAAMVGGPFKFTGLPLEKAHSDLNLTQAEFEAVGGEIVKALQTAGVPQSDIDLLVCLYNTSMDDVVSTAPGAKEVSPPR